MAVYPSMEQAVKEARNFGSVPVYSELKTDTAPAEALLKFKNVSSHCYMLESCEDRENHGRYTFVGYDPKLEISCRNYEVKITDAFGVRRFSSSPQKYIRQILEDYRSQKMMRFPILRAGW